MNAIFIARKQNVPPQDVSLWHENYFRLILSGKQKTPEEPDLPPNVLKNLDRGLLQERSYHHRELQLTPEHVDLSCVGPIITWVFFNKQVQYRQCIFSFA